MASKEKKSGCLSILFKGIAVFVILSIVMGLISTVITERKGGTQNQAGNSQVTGPPAEEPANASPARPRKASLNLSTVAPNEMPKEVRLKETIELQGASGTITAPAGTFVKFVALSGDTVSVDFVGVQGKTTVEATDLRERILEGRRLAKEAEAARLAAERQAAEVEARAEAEATAIREANFKKLEEEIGKRPSIINEGWSGEKKRPPGYVLSYLKRVAKDPASIEFTHVFPAIVTDYNGQKCWGMKFTFRAKNSFGGYVINTGFAYIYKQQVIDLKITADN